jgi:hypothetical protein
MRLSEQALREFHFDKQPSLSSNSGEGGTLSGLRKVSCRLLLAVE